MTIDRGLPIEQHVAQAARCFQDRFGRPPRFAAAAPGRVNLIGEHTDYNDGFVFPIAIERQTIVVADHAPDASASHATLASTQQTEQASFEVGRGLAPGQPVWANYVRGVVAGFLEKDIAIRGFDALIDSAVPVGSGLASSAALEVAAATLLEAMAATRLPLRDKALLCQHAEHAYAGVPCGIMDQFISVMGQAGHAMLLDCRSQEVEQVPLDDPDVVVLVTNTNVQHELVGGEYAQRRAQCEAAARALGATTLRDVTLADLEAGRRVLEEHVYRRARHVLTENARTLQAKDAMRQRDWRRLGELMVQSHLSLRDDFEVSCPELDVLVDLARELGSEAGVYGARMTGGGFGGCTVALVRADRLATVMEQLDEGYLEATGVEATSFATRPGPGARIVSLEGLGDG